MKTTALHNLFEEIAAVVGEEFLIGDVTTSRNGKAVVCAELSNAHLAIARYLGSLARLEEVVVDIGKLQAFGRRYPWKSAHLSRSDHIRFVWMLFLHLTYSYEERLKLFIGQLQEICEHVPVEAQVNSKHEFAILRPIIGDYTKERGQLLHQWPTDRLEVRLVGALELMAGWDDAHSTKALDHYREARADMLATMRGVHRQLTVTYGVLVHRHSALGLNLAKHFAELVTIATNQGMSVVAKRGKLDTSGPSFTSDRLSRIRRRRHRESR